MMFVNKMVIQMRLFNWAPKSMPDNSPLSVFDTSMHKCALFIFFPICTHEPQKMYSTTWETI
jgi:hypothetical protein